MCKTAATLDLDDDYARRVIARIMSAATGTNNPNSCWISSAGKRQGYPTVWVNGRSLGAHRVLYQLLVRPVPPELHMDHLCRTPACVNPYHLQPVTVRENTRRGLSNRKWRRQPHCPRGHATTIENSIYGPTGKRHCRACSAIGKRAFEERRRKMGWVRVGNKWTPPDNTPVTKAGPCLPKCIPVFQIIRGHRKYDNFHAPTCPRRP